MYIRTDKDNNISQIDICDKEEQYGEFCIGDKIEKEDSIDRSLEPEGILIYATLNDNSIIEYISICSNICSNKNFEDENIIIKYDNKKVEIGMSKEDVISILGIPSNKNNNKFIYSNFEKNDYEYLEIFFDEHKEIYKFVVKSNNYSLKDFTIGKIIDLNNEKFDHDSELICDIDFQSDTSIFLAAEYSEINYDKGLITSIIIES